MNDGIFRPLLLRFIVPAVILVLGALCAGALIVLLGGSDGGDAETPAPLVEILVVEPGDVFASVEGSGLVVPAREVSITPEVSGRIVEVSDWLRVGGRFEEGDVMARIDGRDYRLAIEVEQGRVQKAELDYALEVGRGEIAEREWELLGDGRPASEAPLALRGPHLETAAQNLEGARSSLKRARLALERTRLVAPFNAIVVDERLDIGQVIGPGGPVITLHGTDRYWVELAVPIEKLAYVDIPGFNAPSGSLATVTQGAGVPDAVQRAGFVVGLAGQLEPSTRLAQLLVAVDHPLDEPAGALPLLGGAFVDVVIEGRTLSGGITVPRTAVTEGNEVWLVTEQGTLARREVQVAWRGADTLYVTEGLARGDRVVTSPISLPLEGMAVRTEADEEPVRAEVDGQANGGAGQ